MKKQALSLFAILSLLMAAGSAFAQTQKVRADVPFSFSVNKTTMPAGPYTLSNISRGSSVLLIQSDDGKAVKLTMPNAAESTKAASRSKLVFHCYGREHCFLYQVWVEGKRRGNQFPISDVEREIAANLNSRQEVAVLATTAK